MARRMIIVLVFVGILFGIIFGLKMYQGKQMAKAMAFKMPPATVTAIKAAYQSWQPRITAVGSLRAVMGVEVTSEIGGLVRRVSFAPGAEAKEGQVLVELNADADIAQLHALEAAANLSNTTYERDKKQLQIQAVSQALVEAEAADLKGKQAQVEQQAALVGKKTIRAPFDGRLGISMVNAGQYLNPGDKIVTLQSLDNVYVDFTLPQQELSRVRTGQVIAVASDTRPGRTWQGRVATINPKVDPETRNVQIEALIANQRHELLPGMYVSVEVLAGAVEHRLTLPQTAVTYNPYGDTVFIIEEGAKAQGGAPAMTVRQAFVTVGEKRGDQVAILTGVKEGELVVTSGQLKLRNGSAVVINNAVQPSNEASPKPEEQ